VCGKLFGGFGWRGDLGRGHGVRSWRYGLEMILYGGWMRGGERD
jgi:hypothetical protein